MSYRPLQGVRVLDLSRLYPGALATRKLADFGADVVKVEEPGRGDYVRTIPPLIDGAGALHLVCNRGKRSVALDAKAPQGRADLLRLARVADAIVESARPGRFRDLGVDLGMLRQERPELVVCSISGFGQTGPLAPLPSHGMNMDALAGVAVVERSSGRPRFVQMGFGIGVEFGALNAALAIAAAVFGARTTGEGVWIDASCFDAAFEARRLPIASYLGAGLPFGRDPLPLYDLYEASDSRLVLFCAIERKFWESFCRGVGREDLIERWQGADVDFGDDLALRGELERIFATAPADRWGERFAEWDVPGSVVNSFIEALEQPHVQARGLVRMRPDGSAPIIANPLRWNDRDQRPGDEAGEPPGIGEHTDEVFAEWLGEPARSGDMVRHEHRTGEPRAR